MFQTILTDIVTYGPQAIAAAAAAAAVLPKGNPGTVYGKIITGINWLALNVGHAKNAA